MPRGNSTRSKEPHKKEINEKESKILERSVSKSAKPSKKVPAPAQQKDKSPAQARQTRSKSRTNISKSRISKSLVTKNQSSDSENEAESEVNDKKTVVFKKDSYVAFIDREAVLVGAEHYSIGRIVNDALNESQDIDVLQFEHTKQPLNFTRHSEEVLTIKDYQIICSVDLAKPQGASKSVLISKKQSLEVAKLMKNIFDGVKDKINEEEDKEAEESSSEKGLDNASDEDLDQVSDGPVQRTFLRGKRNLPVHSQQPKVLSQLVKPKNKIADAAKVDLLEDDDDDDERPKQKKNATSLQIGKKRPFPPSLENQIQSQPTRKVRKLANGDTESVEVPQPVKAKKASATKKPLVFKLGTWNPDTVLLQKNDELERFGSSDTLITPCCLRCNCRNVIRAVDTNNIRLLRSAMHAKEKIPSVNQRWSIDTPHLTALDMIFTKQNIKMLETFMDVPCKNSGDQFAYDQAANQFFNHERVKVRDPLLTRVDTGKVSYKAYGAAIRQVQQTRGNRQGNQAFVLEPINQTNPTQFFFNSESFKKFMTVDIFKAWSLKTRASRQPVEDFAQYALAGNLEMMIWIIEQNLKLENFGFNKLHLDVLKLQILTEKYATASITKKAANCFVTPLHLACLNPKQIVVKTLLEQNNDFNVQDSHNNKPIHYAAMCSSSGPLTVLLEKGATVFDLNGQKQTPLHFAAKHARAANVQVILENNVQTFKARDKTNKTAFTYALEDGDIETIKAFLDYSQRKIKINTGQGIDRMSPLMYAAAAGRYELAEFLLERKARVLSKDKFQRTALIMAVRNGHTRLASLLLQKGSDMKHNDSSMNTPLHYAAASGFIECIDLLLKHGADLNAMNSWKVTPITIAMLNNHFGTVKRLLQELNVDVNGKDDQGRTLLSMAVMNLEEPNCVEFVKFLLDKGADPNMGDVSKVTPLHILASTKYVQVGQLDAKASLAAQKAFEQVLINLIDLLLSRGANMTLKSDSNQTPFEVALQCDNILILKKFTKSVKLVEDPLILHKFDSKLFDERFREILLELLNQEQNLSPETMNSLDKDGFSPFLAYVKSYVNKLACNEFSQKIRSCLLWNSWKHKQNYSSYIVTNQSVYDQTYQQDVDYGRARDYQNIPELKIQELIKKYIYELFTQPFIEFLKILISKGSDPHMKVGKLQFYRELDEHKRHLLTVGDARDALVNAQQIQSMQIDTTTQNTGHVKTRKEVLAEQNLEKKTKKNKKRRKGENKIEKPFKEFYAKKGYQANFMTVNGKQIEVEYNKEYGLQNAIHLLFRHPSGAIYEFLAEKLGVPIDDTDFLGRNPFLINTMQFATRPTLFKTMEKLLERNVRFDLPDSNGRTPFLIYYEKGNMTLANQLLAKGANIKQMDIGGLFALKYALIRREDSEIKRLVSLGADINQVDNKGRNLLHHAVNMSSATADATFETEQTLIDLGIKINLRDSKGRVPLHYAFVKIKNWTSSDQIDPIETVSSLCAQPDLEIEVPDKWNKTPLHYAAQRSAAICTLYILQRGANIESKDIYGNNVLGISMLRRHFNYAILLIQKQANVCLPIYEEFPKRIAKMWEDEAKEKKRQLKLQQLGELNVDMSESMDSENEDEVNAKTGRDLFNKKTLSTNIFFGGQQNGSDSDEDEYDEEEDEEDKHEMNVFNQQNAFGMQVFAKPSARPAKAAFYRGSLFNPNQQVEPESSKQVEKEQPPKSAFRLAIQNQQQGLAYLILDNKYDYMLAMQDALDEKKFNLVLTLLSKTSDNRIVQRKNDLNQNLMHILAKNSNGGLMHILRRIYDSLRSRGVNCLEQDSLGNNALHYAVQSNCYDLCQILISEGISVNSVNHEGQSPLSLIMRGEDGASKVLRQLNPVAGVDHKTLFTLLANNGADMNICFPEDSFPDEKNYKCSIIINIVRRNSIPMDQLRANLLCLFEYGANLKTVDSRGRDVLMHSIMQNHNELVQFFINNADRGLLKNHKDHEGKNAIFYVVNPVPFGSFENVEILNKILKTGFGYELAATDKYGKTPLDYAKLQKSGVLSSVISQKIGLDSNITNQSSEPTYTPSSHWPPQRFDFDRDSQQLLEQAEAKRVKELMEEQKDSYVPIEKAYQSKQYSVYFEGQGVDRRPYDAYMTKVDLKNGYYGDYTFYKMQIVYDSNRGLYLVITRYGRIGEQGMSQQSPFHNPEDATKEFKTIFKQKSANEWDTAHTAFIKHPKKYVLVNVSYTNIKHQDYLAPFDYENCAKTHIEKAIRLLLEEISNVTMYQRSLQQMGIDQSQLPVSNIKKETILQATKVLNHLGDTFKELTRLRQMDRADFNYEKSHEIYQSLSDLTSQFYQLIPMKETDFWSVRPIQNDHQIKELRDKLDTLTNIEFSSRILLGALFKQMVVNPVDYVYDCIQTNFRQLQTEEPEFSLIHQYISNTCDDNMKKVKFTIFKIQRRGEGERYEKFQSLENRRLLFHGSAMTNMLGILSQGIRIAPPEAPTTGYMFGKGAYFADLFKKSANYSHSGHKTRLMLICEVALGKMMERYTDWMELKLPANYNSVKAIGYLGGNFKDKAIVTPEGYQVPFGAEIQSEKPTEAQFMKAIRQNPDDKRTWSQYSYRNWQSTEPTFSWPLQANEYIVYNVDQVKMRYMIQWEQN